MEDIKNTIGIIAISLTFFGYIPYIRDTLKGKTKPHIYSWFIWASIGAIAFALQLSGGAGIGGFVTLTAVIIACIIFILGLRSGKKDITKFDTLCLVFALLALLIWIFAKQPVFSAVLLTAIEVVAFIPTIRKSWNNPHSETLSFYLMNTLRFTLAIIALQNYSILTTLYPAVWLLGNGAFSIILIVRRKQLANSKINEYVRL
ncbi:MAG: hypothetical protein AAB553_06110 [Patescibacteria group bacterium]